jgi:hypothetical protein
MRSARRTTPKGRSPRLPASTTIKGNHAANHGGFAIAKPRRAAAPADRGTGTGTGAGRRSRAGSPTPHPLDERSACHQSSRRRRYRPAAWSSDPGLAPQHQHAAEALCRPGQQASEHLALRRPADKRIRSGRRPVHRDVKGRGRQLGGQGLRLPIRRRSPGTQDGSRRTGTISLIPVWPSSQRPGLSIRPACGHRPR